jgi:radical SAM superfamily enzyme YgiQ (UPF0313 family)
LKLYFIIPPRVTKANEDAINRGLLASPGYTPFPPLNLAYLISVAKKLGHECQVLDLNVKSWPGPEEILRFGPDLLLLSSMTLQYRAARVVIKNMAGRLPIVIGGAHASIFREKLLEDGIDIVAVGEGENTLAALLANFPNNLESVPGIIFKNDGKVCDSGKCKQVLSLDSLPFPSWEYFDLALYDNTYYDRKCLPVITSRGCPYQCAYCFKGVFGDTVRLRSAKNIFEEIVFLKDRFGVGAVQFQDDTFTMSRCRVEEFCNLLIENKTDILWRCLARVDQVDFKLIDLMRKAGLKSIAFGIESGSQEVLDKLGKKIKLQQVSEAIEACKRVGVVSKGYYIIGLPWDTPKTLKKTFEFAKNNRTTQLQFTLPVAYPGTKLWEIGKERGLPVEDYVESFSWDETTPPYSFSKYLSIKQIKAAIIKARNIVKPNTAVRVWRVAKNKDLRDYPTMIRKVLGSSGRAFL